MFSGILRGTFKGHPVHVMLVHFPSALYPFSLILDVWAWWQKTPMLHESATYALLGGVAATVLVVVFGLIDFLKIPGDHPAYPTATKHAVLQVLVWFLFIMLLIIRLKHPQLIWWCMIGSGLGVILLVIGNFWGGNLVFTYGLPPDKK